MKHAVPVGLVLLMCCGPVVGAGTVPPDAFAFEDQFETYAEGLLSGQGGWEGDGEVLASPDARLGAKTLGLSFDGATVTRSVPSFYGIVRLDVFAEPAEWAAGDACVIEVGARGRVDARVRLGFDSTVSVLQPGVAGPEWIDAGAWDPRDLATVEVRLPGQEALVVSVGGTELFSGVTLGAAEKGSSLPSEFLGVTTYGSATVFFDNIEVIRTTCSADFDGDSSVNVRDLAVLLSV